MKNTLLKYNIFIVIFIPLVFVSGGNINSQNISKYYKSLPHPDGSIFFINPIKGFKAQGRNNLIYDITADTNKDSVIFNFSFYDKRQLRVDSVKLKNSENSFSTPTSSIFVELEKSKFHYRKTTDIYFDDLFKFFSGENPKIIVFANNNIIEFDIRKRRWRKQSEIVQRILSLVELNR